MLITRCLKKVICEILNNQVRACCLRLEAMPKEHYRPLGLFSF